MEADNRPQRHEVLYQGMVQGVGFRYTTRRIAERFSVTGFVRNESDGRVCLVAEGPTNEVQRFFDTVREELGHYISDSQVIVGPATGQFEVFHVRF